MLNNARYKAVLELITEVFKDEKPADNIINDYMRERRYIGSKDRKFIIDNVWNIIRNRRKLGFDINSDKPRDILICYLRNEPLEDIFDNGKYGLESLTKEEEQKLKDINDDVYPKDVEAETPKWIYDKVNDDRLLRSLNNTAPADFRINVKNLEAVIDAMKGEGFEIGPTPYSPIGIRSENRINLINCMTYQEGRIEVQDEASQLVSILCEAKPESKIIDYCAGAGGKSLTLSFLLGNKGKIHAHDIDWHRLEQIKPRIERLGVKNIEITRNVSDNDYDRFVIDAPCSGTGTWRRSPDAKYRLTPKRVEELNKIQSEILETAYKHTKSGGRIIYITCSILKDENENIVSNFLDKHEDVNLLNIKDIWNRNIDAGYPYNDELMLRLSPVSTNTDGFFIAIIKKN
ncbi:MAG: RsmB/NOP family class I SAM-dependent RNA methyltransferase [Lactobacillaceae bacterium]|nr:RsmB/NOP family class I SAM-dependent RNA methyltransferase [Lactobacillaceae bacterium]